MFEDKYNAGKALRNKVARSLQADYKMAKGRPTVLQMINSSNYDRIPDLIPVRHFRMSKSPFVFYRATASFMARDLAPSPISGIQVQACGDCHLMNFGGFATPERHLVVDINDFDETNPGPWEWDVKRLAASFILAGREKNFSEDSANDLVAELMMAYTEKLNLFASMKLLDLWHVRFDLEQIAAQTKEERIKEKLAKAITKANKVTHDHVFYKITSNNLGKFQINEQPPLIKRPINLEESMDMINTFMDHYKSTLQPDRKLLLDQYEIIDVALKVVGVGSVGTRCYVVLLINDNHEPLLMQVKEARESVLAPYAGASPYKHFGERIVQGQRQIQAASDMFLGWATGPAGRHFYFRQLRDKKMTPDIESYDKFLLTAYARLCGGILARAHCKTGMGPQICGYIGKSDSFTKAISRFATAYADQTEKDFGAFGKAIKAGKLPILDS